jgi:Dipeptidyl peptidase IV (DPP IV) N-terminal region
MNIKMMMMMVIGGYVKRHTESFLYIRIEFNYRDKALRINLLNSPPSFVLCLLTHNTGKKDSILNGIPDWLYSNTPDLSGDTLAFSSNGGYLSFLSFNISNVQKYE